MKVSRISLSLFRSDLIIARERAEKLELPMVVNYLDMALAALDEAARDAPGKPVKRS
jgi:hypothetical protein